ncbi:T9SS type A sorting domain-containing protein [Bacteroidota bacterium]
MKRILIICKFFLFSGISMYSQIVEIPDTNFLHALIEVGVDVNKDSIITINEAESIISLDIQDKNISDLTGIEAFINLSSLNCGFNKLDSLDLTNCVYLAELYCYVNQLQYLDVSSNSLLAILNCGGNRLNGLDISSCTALTNLTCFDNLLTSLDLSENPDLSILNCEGNQLTNIDVSSNPILMVLYSTANQLSSLDLSGNPVLLDLSCGSNLLTQLDITQNNLLVTLYCSGNNLSDLDASNNPSLKQLYCDYNQITSLDLSNNPELEILYCGKNQLAYLDISLNKKLAPRSGSPGSTFLDISSMSTLERVCVWQLPFPPEGFEQGLNTVGSENILFDTLCGGNAVYIPDPNFLAALIEEGVDSNEDLKISYLEAEDVGSLAVQQEHISDMTGIEAFIHLDSLDCSDNEVSILDLTNCTELTFLDCHDNELTVLDISACRKLVTLYCYDNQLTVLNVSGNTKLEVLLCAFNQIKELALTKNTEMIYLSCSFNQLDSLDVTKNIKIQRLWCSSNDITNLDVSQNFALAALVCSDNQLTSLDLTQNVNLAVLECRNNSISSLDLSGNPGLGHLDCSGNLLKVLDISSNTDLMIQQSPDFSYGFNLILTDMPSLKFVCVWELPFPPEERSARFDISGSPNIRIADCSKGDTIIQNIHTFTGSIIANIYPNPSDGIFKVETKDPLHTHLLIFDNKGTLLFKRNLKQAIESIDLRGYPEGIYFVRIYNDDAFQTIKMVLR